MELLSDQLVRLIGSVDDSPIASVDLIKAERKDLLVSCGSGRKHLVRLEDNAVSLPRQKWGYEQMRSGGVPCPEVEAFVQPCDEFPHGCMIISWVDAVSADSIIRREGPGEKSFALCRALGKTLRALHGVEITTPIPEYIFTHGKTGACERMSSFVGQLREEALIDLEFERKYGGLFGKYADLIPDPFPRTLCFTDMHFQNVFVRDAPQPSVAALVDVEEIGVGWPMWDFTNWECWGMQFGLSWTRAHVLEGYGDVDMLMYRFALLIRLSRPFTFVGSTREQIVNAVESQDLHQFDIEKLYQ